jgi:hypothetical protein
MCSKIRCDGESEKFCKIFGLIALCHGIKLEASPNSSSFLAAGQYITSSSKANAILLLPPFQIISRFDFFYFIHFAMYQDILLYLDI